MVFCKRIEARDDYAVYHYGASPDKLSGRVTIYSDDRHFTVNQKDESVSDRALGRVWLKYRNTIRDKVFPERMAIQIG